MTHGTDQTAKTLLKQTSVVTVTSIQTNRHREIEVLKKMRTIVQKKVLGDERANTGTKEKKK